MAFVDDQMAIVGDNIGNVPVADEALHERHIDYPQGEDNTGRAPSERDLCDVRGQFGNLRELRGQIACSRRGGRESILVEPRFRRKILCRW